MKKVMTLAVLLVMALTASAKGGDLNIVNGSLNALKDAGKTVLVTFDYSGTTIEGQPVMEYLSGRGEQNVKDWPDDNKEVAKKFVEAFNKNNKKGAQIVNGDKGDYKIVIKAEKLDFGSGAASVVWGFGAGGSKVWGTPTIIDQNSGDAICTLEIDEVDGGSSYTEVGRRCDTAEHLAELLAKLIKKSK